MKLTKSLRRLGQGIGLDITRYRPEDTEDARFLKMLNTLGINLILDIGAAEGAFVDKVRGAGYQGRILSFEPRSGPHALISDKAKSDQNWIIGPKTALGDVEGEATLHISGNGSSSSLLDMTSNQTEAAEFTKYVSEETVSVRRLDEVVPKALPDWSKSKVLLKIDAQGFEAPILAGASGLLPKVDAIQLELSLVELYKGQKLMFEMLQDMKDLGFDIWSMSEVFTHPKTGRLLQIDADFVRSRFVGA